MGQTRSRMVVWLLLASSAVAQQRLSGVTVPGSWSFDVASIRAGAPERRTRVLRHPDDTEYVAQNVSLSTMVQYAFGVTEARVIGLPPQLETARFDVQAKGDVETDARWRRLNPDQQRVAKQTMMQGLLADRCKLAYHWETRELPVYVLVAAKGGAKLQQSDEQTVQAWTWREHINVEGGNTLERLAEELTRVAGRPVVNRTGLTGRYTLELEWAADEDGDADVPTLFTAIREQLGLRLEPERAMVEVVVIDHMELPTAN